MNDDIDKADRIVGLTIAINHDWGCPSLNSWRDKIRRGAYFELLAKRQNNASIVDSVEELAAEVVRIDAEERRKKEPDDGLPPGPWHRDACGVIHDADGELLWPGRSRPIAEATIDHIVRCGSPAVRRLLVAYDVTDSPQDENSVALILTTDNLIAFAIVTCGKENVICWLTPRSKP